MAQLLQMLLSKLSCQRKSQQVICLLRNLIPSPTLSHIMQYTFLRTRRYQPSVQHHVQVEDFVHIGSRNEYYPAFHHYLHIQFVSWLTNIKSLVTFNIIVFHFLSLFVVQYRHTNPSISSYSISSSESLGLLYLFDWLNRFKVF